jgi:hypothetical protein
MLVAVPITFWQIVHTARSAVFEAYAMICLIGCPSSHADIETASLLVILSCLPLTYRHSAAEFIRD